MKYKIGKNHVMEIDRKDLCIAKIYNWYGIIDRNGKIYIGTTKQKNNCRRMILFHRLIMNAPPGLVVDHIDGDTFNNCRSNLRICSYSQNSQNGKSHRDSVSKFKGVSPQGNRWQVEITSNRKRYYIGFFKSEKQAALAYDAAAIKYHSEFAKLNFPTEI